MSSWPEVFARINGGPSLEPLSPRAAEIFAAFRGWDSIEVKAIPWLVEDWLVADTLGVVYGPPGTGKTFLALDLALHVAAGLPWQGKRVEGGPVVYIAGEGNALIDNRISAWRNLHPEADEACRRNFKLLPVTCDFCGDMDAPAVVSAIRAGMDDAPRLIVIDTLARAMGGGDENSGQDMGRFIANAGLLQAETGAHVLIVHHTGKDATRGGRGHSSLKAAVDTEIELSRTERVVTALNSKMRDGADGGEFSFTLTPHELGRDDHGKPITSCTVKPAEKPEPRPKLSGKDLIALQALDDAIAQHGAVRKGDGWPSCRVVALDQWRDMCRAHGLSEGEGSAQRMAFMRARERLHDRGLIRVYQDHVWRVPA